MTPFYFGNSQKQLYGVYHPPTSYSQYDEGILICYPLWEEYLRTHRVITQLCNKLADAGFHVLRFDYYATGDSAGETNQCSLEQFLQDIETAYLELKDLSATDNISIIGLRFGATLGAMFSQKININNLVLWDPVINGSAYINNLKDMQNALVKQHKLRTRKPIDKFLLNENEYFGFNLPNSVLTSISEVDIHKININSNRTTLCVTKEKQEFIKLKENLSQKNIKNTYYLTENKEAWDDLESLKMAHIPPTLIQNIVDSFKAVG